MQPSSCKQKGSHYDEMFLSQKGKCKICKKETPGKVLQVDHCHTTKEVRGLLCTSCNQGLGHFKDNCLFLKSAIYYLDSEYLQES